MENVNEILKSMTEDMLSYRKEYEDTTVQINTIAKEYTDKINELQQQRLALQEEGNKKINVLENRRSQLTGMYSSLYEQYKKISGNEPNFENKQVVAQVKDGEKSDETVKKETPKKESVKSNSKKDTAQGTTTPVDNEKSKEQNKQLSPDEIAKLSEITNTATTNKTVDSNGNEIPDYLVDSFKK